MVSRLSFVVSVDPFTAEAEDVLLYFGRAEWRNNIETIADLGVMMMMMMRGVLGVSVLLVVLRHGLATAVLRVDTLKGLLPSVLTLVCVGA